MTTQLNHTTIDVKEFKKRMIDLDITQEQLAKELGVTGQAIGRFIRGKLSSRRIRDYVLPRLGFMAKDRRPA